MSRIGLLLLTLLVTCPALAAIEVRQFDDPVLAQRYEDLTESLRCPKCENQAIGDSNSPIAADMRERVAAQLQEGRSDREIQDYMIQRFGDYVLYNPRLSERTWLLWGLPAGLVLLGALLIAFIVRLRRNAHVRALSDEERARLDALIDQHRERTE
ncbi:cytochrome c-type biogenesis protein CcmH [Halomonas shantousis]